MFDTELNVIASKQPLNVLIFCFVLFVLALDEIKSLSKTEFVSALSPSVDLYKQQNLIDFYPNLKQTELKREDQNSGFVSSSALPWR